MIYYWIFLVAFLISVIFAPIYIKFATKLKFGQNILEYVGEHKSKQGTPTMGGVIFILPTILVSLFFIQGDKTIAVFCLLVFLAYAIVGFLDDFIKIKFKRNLGLRAYQKIIFQIGIALIVAIFIYKHQIFSSLYIPFSGIQINLGWFVIPFVILVFLATTNSVNLTDGLDGLAGGVSIVFFLVMVFISNICLNFSPFQLEESYISNIQKFIRIFSL